MQRAIEGDSYTDGGVGDDQAENIDNSGDYWNITTNHGQSTSQYILAKAKNGAAIPNVAPFVKKTVTAVTPGSAKHLQDKDDWDTS